jgi:hypothetical protein
LVLAIVVGVFATFAVHGSAFSALLVIVVGILLEMAVLAAVVPATRGAGAGTAAADVVGADRQLGRELETAAGSSVSVATGVLLGEKRSPAGWSPHPRPSRR